MPRPNILVLMVDQMQGAVLRPGHPCHTPNLDRLAERGVRFDRAYTPNAVCSPARASLMTGLLPHNHGVLWVTHTVDPDQGRLRTDRPHWAQRLTASGYRTGYFGKWHVEHAERPDRFGWEVDGSTQSDLRRRHADRIRSEYAGPNGYVLERRHDPVPGYRSPLHYAVTEESPRSRPMGVVTSMADGWLTEDALPGERPWCCFVSLTEPHDPFVAGREAFAEYDVDSLRLPPNAHDDLKGRPGLYRKVARQWDGLTDRERREAMACYYASITEIDTLFGELLDRVERAGQLDDTVVVLTSDHGELLGAHGMYCKNVMAAEEVYHIPLVVAGPGVARGETTTARVGLHQVGPTLLDLVDAPELGDTDGASFDHLLADPHAYESDHRVGFAEYHGGRILLTQRVLWDDTWKLVFNGFDQDELYDLERDPHELSNLVDDPAHADKLAEMSGKMWRFVEGTADHSLANSHYPPLRMASRGPLPDPAEELVT